MAKLKCETCGNKDCDEFGADFNSWETLEFPVQTFEMDGMKYIPIPEQFHVPSIVCQCLICGAIDKHRDGG